MRKMTILLAALFAASISTAADAAKKKAAAPKPDPAIQAQKNTAALIGSLFKPAAAAPAAKPAAKKAAKKGKKAAKKGKKG
jgi:hypothetical protein